jgi:hypothetical protein
MRWPRRSVRAYTTAIGACTMLGLAAQSCGVMSSGDDCTAKATCVDGGALMADDGSQLPDVGDDGAVADEGGGDAGGDVTNDTAVNSDVTSENIVTGTDARDVTSENVVTGVDASDVSSEDVNIGLDASDVTIRDVVTEEAAPRDGCVPTGPENCANGIDDDCNGLIDCADTACAAYVCAPSVPSPWVGPALLWTGPSGTTPPSCPAQYPTVLDANAGPTGSADTCSCACTASGQTCSTTGTFMSQGACQTVSACRTVTPASDGTCTPATTATTCGSGGSFTAPTPSASGGTCTPGVTTTPGSAAGWTTSARLCSGVAVTDSPGGCSTTTDACVLGPPSGFVANVCIYQTGTPACPAAYPNPQVFYSGESDLRGCGPCTCSSSPSPGSCSGTITLYGAINGGCTGNSATFTLGAQACAGAPGVVGVTYSGLANNPGFAKASYTVTPGTCSVTVAPVATGAVTATTPTTVCCR